jgi:glycosyltransferase involved in cell wall biosynthesis
MNNFNEELVDKIKRATFCISGVENITPFMKKYNKNSFFVHQCPDELLNRRLEDSEYKRDVAFIGSIDGGVHSDRAGYRDAVGFKHFYGVFGEEHNKIVNETKINLNFAPTDKSGCSVRLYKIMASGGFVMTTPWNNMEETFTPDEHLVVFNDANELKEKIKYYLDNPEEREKIREAGYKKVQDYMPKSWAKNILMRYEES